MDRENVDKTFFEVSLEDRLSMLTFFFEKSPHVSLGISSHGLFLDKLTALEEVYPSEISIYFIVGYDTITRILDKKYYIDRNAALKALFKKSIFLVANRKDNCVDTIYDLLEQKENREFKARVKALKIPDFFSDISSTRVRDYLKKGMPISNLVPGKINQFILERKLYLTNH